MEQKTRVIIKKREDIRKGCVGGGGSGLLLFLPNTISEHVNNDHPSVFPQERILMKGSQCKHRVWELEMREFHIVDNIVSCVNCGEWLHSLKCNHGRGVSWQEPRPTGQSEAKVLSQEQRVSGHVCILLQSSYTLTSAPLLWYHVYSRLWLTIVCPGFYQLCLTRRCQGKASSPDKMCLP